MPVFWSSVSNSSANSRLSSASPSSSGRSRPSSIARLAAASASGGPAANLRGHGHRRRVHLVVRDDGVGQADLQGLLRADVPAGEDQVLRLGGADQPGEPLRAAGAGDDAEQDLRLADLRRAPSTRKSAHSASS